MDAAVYISLVGIVISGGAVLIIRNEVRALRTDTAKELKNFLDMLHKGHGPKGEPCAAGAPAVVSRSPAPVGVGEPVPVATRGALMPDAHPIVGLSRPFQPSPEQIAMARAAYAEAQRSEAPPVATEGDRPAYCGDEEPTTFYSASAPRKAPTSSPTLVSAGTVVPASTPRAIPWEQQAGCTDDELARFDALAAMLGVTREDVIADCIGSGVDVIELEQRMRRLGVLREPPANDDDGDEDPKRGE